MIKTTSPEIGQQLEKALIIAGYVFKPYLRSLEWHGKRSNYTRDEWRDIDSVMNYSKLDVVFTMGELWQMLPLTIHDDEGDFFELNIIHVNPGYWAAYQTGNGRDYDPYYSDHYDTDMLTALAKLVIWCIENNHPLNLPQYD